MRLTPLMRKTQDRLGRPLGKALQDAYNRHEGIEGAALEVGLRPGTYYSWLGKFNIILPRKAVIEK